MRLGRRCRRRAGGAAHRLCADQQQLQLCFHCCCCCACCCLSDLDRLDWFAVVVVMADNRASNHFQTSESSVHRASPHRSSCAIQRCSSVVILLATTTSRHLLPNCRQGDLPSEADHPRPPLSLPSSHFYSTVNLSLRVSPASRSQVQDRVIRPALHRQIT